MNGDQALQALLDGHKRYLTEQQAHPHQTARRRGEIAQHQDPFAVILGCADSRVPPEIVFDQGLGDLFVIRLAGQVLNDAVLGSVEYAVEHLGVSLVLVLGHESCGAVTAAIKAMEQESAVPGHIESLVDAIKPAVARAQTQPGDLVDNAVRANVAMIVEQLKTTLPLLATHVQSGKLKIVGARSDLDDGVIEIIA
jgi:carbonic anhydrase